MKLIPLSQTRECKYKALRLFAKVDDEDFEKLKLLAWSASKDKAGNFYAMRHEKMYPRKMVLMSRVVMGEDNPIILIDHMYHDTLDNQKKNLRRCNTAENAKNRKSMSGSASKYLGVSKMSGRNRFRSTIKIDGKGFNLGSFIKESDAAKAYDLAAIKFHGEFANLNFK